MRLWRSVKRRGRRLSSSSRSSSHLSQSGDAPGLRPPRKHGPATQAAGALLMSDGTAAGHLSGQAARQNKADVLEVVQRCERWIKLRSSP